MQGREKNIDVVIMHLNMIVLLKRERAWRPPLPPVLENTYYC
jgi:hypothetical protein